MGVDSSGGETGKKNFNFYVCTRWTFGFRGELLAQGYGCLNGDLLFRRRETGSRLMTELYFTT